MVQLNCFFIILFYANAFFIAIAQHALCVRIALLRAKSIFLRFNNGVIVAIIVIILIIVVIIIVIIVISPAAVTAETTRFTSVELSIPNCSASATRTIYRVVIIFVVIIFVIIIFVIIIIVIIIIVVVIFVVVIFVTIVDWNSFHITTIIADMNFIPVFYPIIY